MKTKNKFKRFWYESNACFGSVSKFEELVEMFELQLEHPGSINNVDDFLDKSTQHKYGHLDFGTRMEHGDDTKTLRTFLKENELLDKFLILTEHIE